MTAPAPVASDLRREQTRISKGLLRTIARLWLAGLLDPRRIDETWPGVLPLLLESVQTSHEEAGRAAVSSYVAASTAAGVFGSFRPQPVALSLDAISAIRTSLTVTGPVAMKRALKRGETAARAQRLALVQVQGAASRHALAGARETILQAVSEDPAAQGWARMPRPEACWFCLMLATRGGVYRSKETAQFTTSRSARGAGRTYHDHCRCEVRVIFKDKGDFVPPAHVQRAEQLYIDSTAGKSGAVARKAFADAIAADRAAQQGQEAA